MALVAVPKGTPTLIDRHMRARRLLESDLAQVKRVLAPVVLVPTPAQLARGVRTVDATDDQCPSAALTMRALAAEHGWGARLTYAHALIPPKAGGEDWRERHTVALRLIHAGRGLRGYAVWVDGGFDGARVGASLWSSAPWSATDLPWLLKGVDKPPPALTACPVCRADVPALKAGGTKVHKWLGARCPGSAARRLP